MPLLWLSSGIQWAQLLIRALTARLLARLITDTCDWGRQGESNPRPLEFDSDGKLARVAGHK
jgi:hypothetical protein